MKGTCLHLFVLLSYSLFLHICLVLHVIDQKEFFNGESSIFYLHIGILLLEETLQLLTCLFSERFSQFVRRCKGFRSKCQFFRSRRLPFPGHTLFVQKLKLLCDSTCLFWSKICACLRMSDYNYGNELL